MAARVLIADESATVQKTVSLMLADEGIEVAAVSDGQQARHLLDTSGADLVIAGLSLPKIGGEELCRYIKSSRHLRHIAVILLVGAFEPLDAMEALRIGADAQLARPPQSRPLIQTVRNLLEKSNSNNRPSLLRLFDREHDSQAEEAADAKIENLKPQSVFFKPYMPPPDLTVEQLSLEVRALPARVQSNKLERKPERVPEGASMIVMTALAILAVVGLVLWLVTRSGDTALNNMPASVQAPASQAQPAYSTQPDSSAQPEASANEAPADQLAAMTENKADNDKADNNKADNNGAASNPDQPSDDRMPPAAISRVERDGRSEEKSRSEQKSSYEQKSGYEQNNRASMAPVAAPSLAREQMLTRARSYEERGMLAQAEEHYRAVLHNFPGDATSRLAISRLQARVAAARRDQTARANRDEGLRAFRSGNYSAAINSLAAALNAGRGDTVVLYSLGMSQWKLGRSREAQAAFERCLVANPSYAPAMVGLAQVKAAAGNRAEAVALLNRALQLGGGAEFSPERIREMIARYTPRPAGRNR
jgi:DNA-binding response OmpR family regulator/tetratricopeptide (TPR) repeat protein